MKQLRRYVALLLDDWIGWISTGLTLLTLLMGLFSEFTFFPSMLARISKEVWVLIAFISFTVANFQIFRKLERDGLHLKQVDNHISLSSGGIVFDASNEAHIPEEFLVHFEAQVLISGPRLTSVELFIASIEPDYLATNVSPADLELKVAELGATKHQSNVPLQNPFHLEKDTYKVLATAKIPFSVPDIEKELGSLASMREMTVTLGATHVGQRQRPVFQSVRCDLTSIHQTIEKDIATRIQHAERQNSIDGAHLVEAMKEYWTGK